MSLINTFVSHRDDTTSSALGDISRNSGSNSSPADNGTTSYDVDDNNQHYRGRQASTFSTKTIVAGGGGNYMSSSSQDALDEDHPWPHASEHKNKKQQQQKQHYNDDDGHANNGVGKGGKCVGKSKNGAGKADLSRRLPGMIRAVRRADEHEHDHDGEEEKNKMNGYDIRDNRDNNNNTKYNKSKTSNNHENNFGKRGEAAAAAAATSGGETETEDNDNCDPRTLVICLDGTGDQFDSDNSNIVLFVSCLVKHSPAQQVTYYQSGIGTYDKGGLQNGIAAGMDMAVGSGLGTHIKDAYRFLMQNYRRGDKICLLGFSRGAYTVRCLAGMLHKVGLLPASNGSQVNFAYSFYKDETDTGKKLAGEFKRTFCTHVDVYFLGLWDCVASVGFFPRKLPLSKCPPANTVRYVRHAMALDERRAKFKVCQWNQDDPNAAAAGDASGKAKLAQMERKAKMDPLGLGKLHHQKKAARGTSHDDNEEEQTAYEKDDEAAMNQCFARHDASLARRRAFATDVLEVWFKGTHADVGGGAVKNESRHMLSRIPLRWMIRQCFECDTGILFATDRLADLGLDVHGLYPVYDKLDRSEIDGSGGMPPDGLMRKYRRGTLAPLHRRSTVLKIGPRHRDLSHGSPMKSKNQDREEDGHDSSSSSSGAGEFNMSHYILPSEAAEDYFDSREPSSDMLRNARMWWILEVWPVKIRVLVQDESAWAKKVRMNLGRHRAVRETGPKLHWTVQRLLDNEEYSIKGRITKGTEWKEIV